MTPAEAEALGRRWIAAGGGWQVGMIITSGTRDWIITSLVESDASLIEADSVWPKRWGFDGTDGADLSDGAWWPLLTYPATRGAALEVVRERWGDPTASTSHFAGKWTVAKGNGHAQEFRMCDSEAEALVAGLEAAPKVTP